MNEHHPLCLAFVRVFIIPFDIFQNQNKFIIDNTGGIVSKL